MRRWSQRVERKRVVKMVPISEAQEGAAFIGILCAMGGFCAGMAFVLLGVPREVLATITGVC